jgi:hypothetical protein
VICAEEDVDGRLGRVFVGSTTDLSRGRAALQTAYAADANEEVADRLAALGRLIDRAVLGGRALVAVTHREETSRDRLHVFFRNPDLQDLPQRLFACVLRPSADVVDAVRRDGFYVDSLDEQAIWPQRTLTMDVVRAALQGWIERCFATKSIPPIVLDPWTGDVSARTRNVEVLFAEAAPRRSTVRGPASFRPSPNVAKSA